MVNEQADAITPEAKGIPVGEPSPALQLEAGYTNLGAIFTQCDRLIPKEDLEIWNWGLTGTRVPKKKEFEAKKALPKIRKILASHFPEAEQQVRILQAATNFLGAITENVDPNDYDSVPLGQLDRFLAGFPQNMIDSLGSCVSVTTIAEILRIGTHAVGHRAAELKEYEHFHPNGALGTIALLVGEAIPDVIAHASTNQQTILANFDQAASTLSSYRLQDTIESYQRLTVNSLRLSSPEKVQVQMMQMEAAIREVDPDIVEHQFKQDQVQALMDTIEAVTKAIPDSDPNTILATLSNQILDQLRIIHATDRIAGHLLIGQGIRVITRGVRRALECGTMTLDQLQQGVQQQTEVTGAVIRQLNAGRTGRNDRETDDWNSIGLALNRDIVQRVIDVNQATQGAVTTDEIIGWINGARTPIWDETWRIEGILVTGEVVAHQSQQQGTSTSSAELVAQTVRALNELPGVIINRGATRIRDSLYKDGLTLSASDLSEALLVAHRGYAGLLNDTEIVDHQPIRAPENETRAIQLERGFEFAVGIGALRERILRAFLTDANRATQITRGCALVEDVYRPNIFHDRPYARVQEILASFPDPVNIDTFLNGLGRLMDIYDQQTTIGQRQLIKDALAFVLNTDNPTETMTRLFNGQAHGIKSAAWFGRLVGENKTNLSLLDIQPAIALLTGKSEESTIPSGESRALVQRHGTTNLIPQIADSSLPLGNALQAYMIARGGGEEGLQAVRQKIGSLELHTAEDAQAFLPALTQAMSRFLHVSPAELQARMVTVQPIARVIEQAAEENPIAATILKISSMFGGGEVPHIAYAPRTNTIFINEESPRNYSVDELGEEVAHWVREVARPNGEDSDPIVHEFFGFLGRRIVRKVLGLPDVITKPEDLAEGILEYQRSILDAERFPSMIDTGFEARLRSTYAHLIGYVAASNIPLDQITDELIRLGEQEVKNRYINLYGLGDDWFEMEEQRIKDFFAKESTRASFGEPIAQTTLNKLLNALHEARDGRVRN